MPTNVPLDEKGLIKYPISRIILGNVLMMLWLIVGTVAVWFYSPLLAAVYLIVAILVVYIVLRKIICTNCYYYDKWCSLGWGKLAAALFKQGNIEQFNESIGIKLAPIVYGLLTIFPLIVVVIAIVLVEGYFFYKIGILIVLLFFSVLSGSVSRKSACGSCKMKSYCKGSAVKQ